MASRLWRPSFKLIRVGFLLSVGAVSLLQIQINVGVFSLYESVVWHYSVYSAEEWHLPFINTTSGQVEYFASLADDDDDDNLTKYGYDVEPLLELSRTFTQPPSHGIKAAICVKTLHGQGKKNLMNHVLSWVAYNRLLGFDDILIWYSKNHTPPGFQHLERLPYVKLIENTRNPQVQPGDYEVARDNPGGQEGDIAECHELTSTGGYYDWVLVADWDEFLWFSPRIRLKEFLAQHHNDSYLSFGKWMYTYKDVVVESPADKDNLFLYANVSLLQ